MATLGVLALGTTLLAMGLFSGLMFSLIVLLQPKWNQQTASEYITDIQPFLKVGKGNTLVAVALFTGILAPVLALLSNTGAETIVNVLVLLGTVVFVTGAFGITVALNLPTYNAIMRLDAAQPTDDWVTLRQRFYRLNLARFLSSTMAFVLLIAAVIIQL